MSDVPDAPASSAERKRACLEAAIAACCGDRALNYGKPEDNFARIAELWSAWFSVRVPPTGPAPFSPFDVAVMNILLKLARLANTPDHQDSWIDIAGYAACGADITGEQRAAPPFDINAQKVSDAGIVAAAAEMLVQPNRFAVPQCINCRSLDLVERPWGGKLSVWCKKCGWKQ